MLNLINFLREEYVSLSSKKYVLSWEKNVELIVCTKTKKFLKNNFI